MDYAHFFTLITLFALVVAVVTRTITREEIFAGAREWVKHHRLKHLLHCSYCCSHWVAAGLAIATGYTAFAELPYVLSLVLTVFVLVGAANALLVAYEFALIKIKVFRTQYDSNLLVIAGQRLNNELVGINLDQSKELVERVKQHNAQAEAHQLQQVNPAARVGN